MKVKFISNACCVVETNEGTQILTDPWIENGVFEGSWCHFHKLKTSINDLQNIDAIYVSHIHPDHYDDRFFNFPKDIPIIVLDHGLNFLHRKLLDGGYKNLIKIKNKETIKFKDLELTLFAPFVKHNFFEDNSKLLESLFANSCINFKVLSPIERLGLLTILSKAKLSLLW